MALTCFTFFTLFDIQHRVHSLETEENGFLMLFPRLLLFARQFIRGTYILYSNLSHLCLAMNAHIEYSY